MRSKTLLSTGLIAVLTALPALPATAGPSACPQWAEAIAFARDDPVTGYDIFVVQPDGTGLIHLDTNPHRWDGEPQWSPDHCRIAYSAKVKGADHEIRVINPDGSGMITVGGGGDNDRDSNPSWSPDGRFIVYSRALRLADGTLGEDDLWIVDLTTGATRQLTSLRGDEHWIAWSPVDDRIAFEAEVTGRNDIFVINADGGGLTQLTAGQKANGHPAWSPDGSQIAFTSNRSHYIEIWIMNADGSNPRQITRFGSAIPGSPQYLAFSPDGSQLVFSMQPERSTTDKDLYVMNLDGSGLHNLTALFSEAADGARDVWADW